MLSVNERTLLRKMKTKRLVFRFTGLFGLLCFIFSLPFFILPLYTQSVGDLVVTEIMHVGDDWIEIMNTTGSAITMTDLSVQVDDSAAGSITVHGTTSADLAAGKIAVVVSNASTFVTAHNNYPADNIYVSSALRLPSSGATVKLKNATNDVASVTYSTSNFSKLSGVSLHRTLGDVFLPAPVTPGSVAINPVTGFMPIMVGVSVSTSVTGGEDADDRVFVDAGDVVTLYVLSQDSVQSLTASLSVGGVTRTLSLTETSGAGGVMHSGEYTIVEGDIDGVLGYTVTYPEGGSTRTKKGFVTHSGKQVSIDTTDPVVASTVSDADVTTRKVVTFTITDKNQPTEIEYVVSVTSCGTETTYTNSSETKKKVAVEQEESGQGEARVVLSSADANGTYICVKVADKAGNTVYGVSSQISGIVAASLRVTELVYAPVDGASFEWIEVVNTSNANIWITDYVIVDGGRNKGISAVLNNEVQSTRVAIGSGQVAVIVRNQTNFKTKYPAYRGPLFKSTFSLNDTGDTIGLKSSDPNSVLVDQASYVKSDGAYRNGTSLHVRSDGSIFEDSPNPGTVTQEDASTSALQYVSQYADDVLVKVTQFNGQDVVEGQNLFFTGGDSATVTFSMRDKETVYTELNIGNHLTEETTSSNNFSYRTERTSVEEQLERGVVEVTYTIHFSPVSGSAADNRIILYPKLTDDSNNVSSKRSAVTVVRNTVIPTVANPSNATVLGFPASENVIIPVTVSGVVLGDWVRPVYAGSCGDGLSSYIAKNGGHGVYYNLPIGDFTDCTISVRDSAGNVSGVLSLPRIRVGQI